MVYPPLPLAGTARPGSDEAPRLGPAKSRARRREQPSQGKTRCFFFPRTLARFPLRKRAPPARSTASHVNRPSGAITLDHSRSHRRRALFPGRSGAFARTLERYRSRRGSSRAVTSKTRSDRSMREVFAKGRPRDGASEPLNVPFARARRRGASSKSRPPRVLTLSHPLKHEPAPSALNAAFPLELLERARGRVPVAPPSPNAAPRGRARVRRARQAHL
jgi:hypothetical protein